MVKPDTASNKESLKEKPLFIKGSDATKEINTQVTNVITKPSLGE